MAARLGGGIVALVLAGLLIWLGVASLGQGQLVVPNVRLTLDHTRTTTGGEAAITGTRQVLAARTRLMDDRQTTGAAAFPELALGEHTIVTQPGVPAGRELVRDWLLNRPSGDILRDRGDVAGTSSLPYRNADVLQQPGGRDWRRIHNGEVRYGGGWLILGIGFALAVFLAARGRIPLAEGWSGRTVERFNVVERANHWMTAGGFVVMALTGLTLLYGKPLLMPWMGESAFGTLAWWSAWLHMSAAVPFVLGIVLMIALWIRDNIPTRLDWQWLKRGGGFMRNDGNNPPARRFNAGQKIVFWGVILGGLAALASGITLMLPFFWLGYDGMQAAQIVHAVIAVMFVALIVGHIYIGTVGMEGAIDAMWSGQVDRNWAKEHHRLWYDKISDSESDDGRAPPAGQPVAAE
jgi:formate dehydrogenase subunit gamma